MTNNLYEQQALNRWHADNPEVGDYWSEMSNPAILVLDVNDKHVCFHKLQAPIGTKNHVASRASFARFMRCTDRNTTWANVVPKSITDDVCEYLKTQVTWASVHKWGE